MVFSMEVLFNALLIIGVVSGGVFTTLSIFVLHGFEKKLGKRPPAFNFWPFYKELKEVYPNAAKVGSILEVAAMACFVVVFAVNYVGKQ